MTLITLLAFAVRMVQLADVPPRWDEGWSVAHATLPIAELLSITAQDVHPPLFYLLLGAWQVLIGVNLFGARLLGVLMAAPAIPLAYGVGRVWSGSRVMGVLAAMLLAWLPLHVYYSAVVRMYALAPTFILLATYALFALLKHSPQRRGKNIFVFVIGATGAMLTLYHAAWSLIAVGLYALLASRFKRLAIPIAAALLVYAPWAIYAIPTLLSRASAEAATNAGQHYPLSYFLWLGLSGLTLSQFSEARGLWVMAAIVVAGIGVAVLRRRSSVRLLALPVLMVTLTVLFVAIAARQWALNERMLVGAAPGLALLLAWALHTLGVGALVSHIKTTPVFKLYDVSKASVAIIAALALVTVYWPTSSDFVYRKSLEVFDPYNPHTYHQHIAPRAQPNDIVFFNVLSPAGFYALDRQPNDPHWSYALTWDPVKEPRRAWEDRITTYAQSHPRMWFVLYRGLAGTNGDLRGWLDSTFYPASAEWGEEEVFYGLYGAPPQPLKPVSSAHGHWPHIELRNAELSASVQPGEIIAVRLDWQVLAQIPKNYKVFVHARTADGAIVAQHDAMPLNDLRPMTSLRPGEGVRDNHGLGVPGQITGTLDIVMGLYDPDTGQRIPNLEGETEITLGKVEVGLP